MRILYRYLKRYRGRVLLALFLATVNQCFSLLDPQIFRHIVDDYVSKFRQYTGMEFFRGVSVLLLAAVGVAFISRVAKNFQDYFINVITQRLGAEMYADGLKHSLELPYQVFEDQRSGETLGKLQKMRTDVERMISMGINFALHDLRRRRLRDHLRDHRPLADRPDLLLHHPHSSGGLSAVLSRKIKKVQKVIVAETTALAGLDDGVAAEHRAGQEPRARPAGDRPSERDDGQDPPAGTEEGALPAQPELRPGNLRQCPAHGHPRPDALPDLRAADHLRAVLRALDLLVLHLRAAAGAGEHHQRLPGVARCL